MATKIDWGAWANQAFSTAMDIFRKQTSGTSTYGGKTYYASTPDSNPVRGGFLGTISWPIIALVGVAVAVVFFLLKRR